MTDSAVLKSPADVHTEPDLGAPAVNPRPPAPPTAWPPHHPSPYSLVPTSGLALASLILSLLPFLVITPAVSLVLGVLALKETGPSKKAGREMAIIGIVISGFFTLLILGAIFLPLLAAILYW